jgi:1-acyl-sn-glycerol-3-phosphate acyltransferase
MSLTWDGPEREKLPPLGLRETLTFGLRAALIGVVTLLLFGLFLLCRGIDLLLKALWRRHLPALAPWVVHLWGMIALPLAGLGYGRTGRPMNHPGALVANHASWLDIVAMMKASRVFFVSKAEVATWPGIGLIGRAIGTIFIERRPAEARRQRDILFARLIRGDRMAIFPEGTSTDGRRVLPFKSTLFEVFLAPELRETVWVQPVSIIYTAPPGLPASFFGWWGDMDFLESARLVLARGRGGRVDLVFHEPLRVADFADRKALARAAEAAVRAGLEARIAAPAGR